MIFSKYIKSALCVALASASMTAYAHNTKVPDIIDFRKIERGCGKTNEFVYEMGLLSFNGAPEVSTVMTYLKKAYNISDVVETGSFQGNTTALFGNMFDKVYSIEINQENYEASKASLAHMENVQIIKGSSEKALAELLPSLRGKRVLFYLDAHWEEFWPIREELEVIAKTHKDNCVIVVDDAMVPGYKDVAFDSYKDQPLSYDYIKKQLDEVFTNYSVHYIITSKDAPRAQMLILPKK